jgi:putative transposase
MQAWFPKPASAREKGVSKSSCQERAYRIGLCRYRIVAELIERPSDAGELAARIRQIAARSHVFVGHDDPIRVSERTLERWYAKAKNASRPGEALQPKLRSDRGEQRAMSKSHKDWIGKFRLAHPAWSVQLLFDNLVAAGDEGMPSYSTVLRYMRAAGLLVGGFTSRRASRREVRSFEVSYVGELWHMDFHKGSRDVLTEKGTYVTPLCVAFIDDKSRLVCHAQWYLNETTEVLVHAFTQAVMKRGLPRTFYTDCGAAMRGAEFTLGLETLCVRQERTLPYSPHQNGKQEAFWQPLEGRLMKMIPKGTSLTLDVLNRYTQAWVEQDYNAKEHRETKQPPLERFFGLPSVHRPSPDIDAMRSAFALRVTRSQRQTDGTVALDGVRFQVPQCYRHLESLKLSYARWDLSWAHILCPDTNGILARIQPVPLERNARGIRHAVADAATVEQTAFEHEAPSDEASNLPPLLARCLDEYAKLFPHAGYMPLPPKPEESR